MRILRNIIFWSFCLSITNIAHAADILTADQAEKALGAIRNFCKSNCEEEVIYQFNSIKCSGPSQRCRLNFSVKLDEGSVILDDSEDWSAEFNMQYNVACIAKSIASFDDIVASNGTLQKSFAAKLSPCMTSILQNVIKIEF